ncbi:chromosome partitioning protein [Paucibacter oligotrophus]|uniref:Chromosome partitioning protein n=1 Tax=Roseateles oligotrophus TaxID=1769250 RepID=A0A840LA49_9BURK|nr:ParA family protein [Roseateles oligotrophus]MBB4843613.1 chromosome partitioning protein [Roseateles oligotrophus]
MPVILVANPKGGVGKSTLATNIAGMLAWAGHKVMLGDVDKQQSSRRWLALRPPHLPQIQGWDFDGHDTVKPPKGVSHVVMDTPAGLDGKKLKTLYKLADKIIIPLQPSLFDIQASFDFLGRLHEQFRQPEQTKHRPELALVGMRAKEGTLSVDQLQHFLPQLNAPFLGFLRDTQNYVQLAARGLTLWDVAPGRVERDLQQWQPLVAWLERRHA